MARRFRSVTQAAAFALLALLPAFGAAPTASPTPPLPNAGPDVAPAPTPAVRPSPTAQPKPPKPDQWAEARRVFEQLSPDQKNKFLDNLDQWKAMSPEQQELYRDRELFRREKIAQEIQEAINKSGLHLDDDQREVYALRYTQERRKIEEAIRKDIDRKRQSMVGDMVTRLKAEFSGATQSSSKPVSK